MTTKLLANQYQAILNDPVEGFTVELVDDSNLYEWKVYLEGPRDTCYEKGVFQLVLNFPKDYPMSPPTLKFVSEFWHPNVYDNGNVCMSILHPPGDDAMSGELSSERWLPTQSVTTIILSLMSLLNDPNCSSPANVDASVEWRKNKPSYVAKCKKLVEKANEKKPAHVVIPHPDTDEAEHRKNVNKWKEMNKDLDYDDFYEPNDDDEEDEEDESIEHDASEDDELSSSAHVKKSNSSRKSSRAGSSLNVKGKVPDSPLINSAKPDPEIDTKIAHGDLSGEPHTSSSEARGPSPAPVEAPSIVRQTDATSSSSSNVPESSGVSAPTSSAASGDAPSPRAVEAASPDTVAAIVPDTTAQQSVAQPQQTQQPQPAPAPQQMQPQQQPSVVSASSVSSSSSSAPIATSSASTAITEAPAAPLASSGSDPSGSRPKKKKSKKCTIM